MASLLGSRRKSDDRQPLLPQHRDQVEQPEVITGHQKSLDKKLHTYLLVRALARGYLPSTDQSIILLRKLLASDVLAKDNQNLTHDGRKFVTLCRKLVSESIDLLKTKNSENEIQNFMWTVRKARLHVDVAGLGGAAVNVKTANAKATYQSLTTIASLVLQNSDFNKLFSDVTTIFRQVLASSAQTAADYTKIAAQEIEPSTESLDAVTAPADPSQPRVDDEAREVVGEVEETLLEGAVKVKDDAIKTLQETATPARKNAMKSRVREAVVSLRRNADYNSSVSTITILLKSYLTAYSTALADVASEVTDDVRPNKALNRAGVLLWSFITSFGDKKEWDSLKQKVDKLLEHKDRDPEFENIINVVVDSLHRLLTDPNYLFSDEQDETSEKFNELQIKFRGMDGGESLKDDLDSVIRQTQRVYISVRNDQQISSIKATSLSIADLVMESDSDATFNKALVSDIGHVLVPLALQTIQYLPIPRITLVSPDLDLLLEPLILEPGKTVNHSSFFPYRVGVVTTNEVDVFKGRMKTRTHLSSTARVKIEGITIKAEDVGYIMKLHKSWLLSLKDSGLASFRLDEKGMDIYLDLEFTRSSVDEMVILKGVSVKLHKLDFTLRRSKFSILAWLLKPIIRPIMRKLIQDSIRDALEQGLRTINREMIYTRERLRATQIANPNDLTTFVKAILARWQPPDDDVEVSIGWRAHRPNGRAEAPFDGEFAPGSLTKVFESEGIYAPDRVEEGDEGGWRNECFTI